MNVVIPRNYHDTQWYGHKHFNDLSEEQHEYLTTKNWIQSYGKIAFQLELFSTSVKQDFQNTTSVGSRHKHEDFDTRQLFYFGCKYLLSTSFWIQFELNLSAGKCLEVSQHYNKYKWSTGECFSGNNKK